MFDWFIFKHPKISLFYLIKFRYLGININISKSVRQFMGGFYLSLQVPSNDTNKISNALEKLCSKYSGANMRLYYGQPINGWTGIYPPIQTTVESFAKDLSEEIDDFVLLLGSYDEDEFHCQFYR